MPTPPKSPSRETEKRIRQSTPHNFFYLGLFEIVYTAGIAFYLPMTVIPAYLLHLNVSKTVVQTVMTVLTLIAFTQLWGPKISHHPARKWRLVLLWSIGGLPWALYGILHLTMGTRLPPPLLITLFIILAYIGWISNNLASPGYSELMFLNIAKPHRGRFGSILSLTIGIGGLAGSLLVSRFMGVVPSPDNYHYAFIIGGAAVLISSIILSRMHDNHAREYQHQRKNKPLIKLAATLWQNFNFRVFLLFFALILSAQALAPLFISYSRDVLQTPEEGAGYFTLAYFAGIAVLGAALPLLADRFGFRIIGIITAALFAAAFLLPLFLPAARLVPYISYSLYATSLILCNIVLANLGHEMVREIPPSLIIAIGRTIVMPIMIVIGPLSGLLIDLHGDAAYLTVFVSGALMNLIALLGFVFIIREPRTGEEIFLRIRRF